MVRASLGDSQKLARFISLPEMTRKDRLIESRFLHLGRDNSVKSGDMERDITLCYVVIR